MKTNKSCDFDTITLMDKTTTWLVRITCLVFLGGVIAGPIIKKQQKIENFCLKISEELTSFDRELDKDIMREDCRKQPEEWGYDS